MSLNVISNLGIGIGFAHYLPLIAKFPKCVPIYMLEFPHISMRIVSSIPSHSSTTRAIDAILEQDFHTDACFVAHSLGTAAVAWMLKPQLIKISNRVASTVLLDPINFLLSDPTLAYSFVYHTPTTVLELLLSYFVSRELYIAWSIGRHFRWSWNVLFVEDLPRQGLNFIVLSGGDGIVPAKKCERYFLSKKQEQALDGDKYQFPHLDVILIEGMAHGELMLRQDALQAVSKRIHLACGIIKEDGTIISKQKSS